MCESCDSMRRRPLDDESMPIMLAEATSAALRCCDLLSNGWFSGANGIFRDMHQIWNMPALARMCFVWASAIAIYPDVEAEEPRMVVHVAGTSEITKRLAAAGMDNSPEMVSHMVSTGDQASARTKHLASLALEIKLDEFDQVLSDTSADEFMATSTLLMAKASQRLAMCHEHHDEDGDHTDPLWQLAHEKFTEHVNPFEDDDQPGN